MANTKNPAKTATATEEPDGFTDAERAAIKERAQELRATKRGAGKANKAAEEAKALLAKIAEMPDKDRAMAEQVHAVITATAPDLAPKLWYGMPAYYKDGKVLCFFQSAEKFQSRYATLGFEQQANLDDGDMWPTAYALTALTAEVEARIGELVKRAVG